MKPAPFDYVRPSHLGEATEILVKGQGSAIPISGGQSLMPMLSLRVATAETLVDISRLFELKTVEETSTGISYGAATTHAAIEDGKLPDPSRGLMHKVASGISYRAVRNFGTMGGSLALADPAADWPACLMALGALVTIVGPDGNRTVTVPELIEGPYTTILAPGEVITSIEVPRLPAEARWGYSKFARKSGAFANSLSVAVIGGGNKARVVIAGSSTSSSLLTDTASLLDRTPDATEDDLKTAIRDDLTKVDPNGDDYQHRSHAAIVLRAVQQARLP